MKKIIKILGEQIQNTFYDTKDGFFFDIKMFEFYETLLTCFNAQGNSGLIRVPYFQYNN